jgi:hypothetical protein
MARIVATSAWTAVLALSINSGCSGDVSPPAGGAGGAGGAGASTSGSNGSTTAGPTSVAAGPTSGASGTGGSMVMPFVCDPPAAPGSIYEHSAESLDVEVIDPVSMCKYRGDVMLIVNTAAA